MATVRLFFEPFPLDGVDGLEIEESADGLTGWTQIEALGSGAVGTFPTYINDFTTTNAVSSENWFRIRWILASVAQGYSEAVKAYALPPHYTVVAWVTEGTRLVELGALGNRYIQDLIDQAFHMIENHCGPFNVSAAGFINAAPIAMRLYVEYLFMVQNPDYMIRLAGVIREKTGSYMIQMEDGSSQAWDGISVPGNVAAMMCPFSTEEPQDFEMITTAVFPGTPWFDGDETDLDRKNVVTTEDPMRLMPDVENRNWWTRRAPS